MPLKLALALFIAYILNYKINGVNFFRTAYYIPSILGGSVAIAVLWKALFRDQGLINSIIRFFGGEGANWLSDPKYALFIISLLRVWQFGSAMVSCALFQFMWSSNDFMGPLLYVKTVEKYPATIFVKLSMDADTGFDWNRVLAVSFISIIPQLIVFFCAQNQFIDGISAGSVKG